MKIDERPTHLDLFSGIGGFALAAQWAGFRTIGFCEIDKYCQKVLAKNFLADAERKRISDWGRRAITGTQKALQGDSKEWEWLWLDAWQRAHVRTCGNIFELDGYKFGGVSLITGGFPCQPYSVAGKRGGASDDRAIWPEMFRVISEARPAWVLGENVPGIIPMELDNVLSDLEGIGYATRAFVIPACAVDARHRRDRVWIVCRRIVSDTCEPGSQGSVFGIESGNQSEMVVAGCSEEISNSKEQRLDGEKSTRGACTNGCTSEHDRSDGVRWLPEPDVGRVAHGIPKRVDRLKGLGNAIVPQVAFEILREIRKLT